MNHKQFFFLICRHFCPQISGCLSIKKKIVHSNFKTSNTHFKMIEIYKKQVIVIVLCRHDLNASEINICFFIRIWLSFIGITQNSTVISQVQFLDFDRKFEKYQDQFKMKFYFSR